MADATYWAARLATKKLQLEGLDAIFDFFATNLGVEEYSIDTGASDQTVRRADLTKYRLMSRQLEADIAGLQARVEGCGVTRVRGAF